MPIKASDLAAIVRAVAPFVREVVLTALAALTERVRALEERPAPRGEPGPAGAIGPPGPAGRDGLDGRDGLPGVPGPQGADGRPGQDGISGRDGIDGAAGAAGRDGADGLGFEELDVIEEDGRQVLRCVRGDRVKTWRLHTLSDRGIFKAGTSYLRGDGVSWDGAFWIAQADTTARPGESSDASRAWRLAVKRGRDGRDGKAGEPGPRGPQGLPGGRV